MEPGWNPLIPIEPIPREQLVELFKDFGAKGDTGDRVCAEMWARGWVVTQGPIPNMRITT